MPKNALEGEGLFKDLPPTLKRLYIMDNPRLRTLSVMPQSLTVLCAGNIGLERLDESILELVNLQTLSLPGNRLVGLPAGISRLKALKELDLSKNLLWRVPMELREIVTLDSLSLQGNPLPGPLKRNLVMRHKMLEWFDEVVTVYETFLVLFMCWTRQRKEPSGEMELGRLPRDCLNVISSFAATKNKHAPPEVARPSNRVARPKLAEGNYNI